MDSRASRASAEYARTFLHSGQGACGRASAGAAAQGADRNGTFDVGRSAFVFIFHILVHDPTSTFAFAFAFVTGVTVGVPLGVVGMVGISSGRSTWRAKGMVRTPM